MLLPLLVLAYMVWALTVWIRAAGYKREATLRSLLAFGSLLLAFTSVGLHLYAAIHIQLQPHITFYDPFSMKVLRFGFWISVAGIVLGAPSNGGLRWPAVISSGVLAAFWLAIGTAE